MRMKRDGSFLNKDHVVMLKEGSFVIPLVEASKYHTVTSIVTDDLGLLRNLQLWEFVLPDGSIGKFFLSIHMHGASYITTLSTYFDPVKPP